MLAGVVDQRGQVGHLAAAEAGQGGLEAADDAERVDGRAEHELQGQVAEGDQVPGLLVGQVAGDGACGGRGRQERVVAGGAEHEHLVGALELHDAGLDADDGVPAGGRGLGRDAG